MTDGKSCCFCFSLQHGVTLIMGLSFLTACILVIEGVYYGELVKFLPMTVMYLFVPALSLL